MAYPGETLTILLLNQSKALMSLSILALLSQATGKHFSGLESGKNKQFGELAPDLSCLI